MSYEVDAGSFLLFYIPLFHFFRATGNKRRKMFTFSSSQDVGTETSTVEFSLQHSSLVSSRYRRVSMELFLCDKVFMYGCVCVYMVFKIQC